MPPPTTTTAVTAAAERATARTTTTTTAAATHHRAAAAANEKQQERQCARLRSLVQDCIAKHLNASAVFYADKLLVLSGGAPSDVYLLAQAMYVARQPLRALALLKSPPARRQQQQKPQHQHQPQPQPQPQSLLRDARFAYLAAKCAAAAGDWHEALVLLGSEDGAEAELEALELAWAPALAAAAARAAADGDGDASDGHGHDGAHREGDQEEQDGDDDEGPAGRAAAAAARRKPSRGSSAGGAAGAAPGGRPGSRRGGGSDQVQQQLLQQQQQQQQQCHRSSAAAGPPPPSSLPPGAGPASGTEVALSSAVCLLRGRGYLALDDRARAARWLRAALLRDPFCEEAFGALVDGALLPAPAEVGLVLALPLSPADEWLRLLYRARCKQYGPGQERELGGVLDELERPYAPHGRLAAGAAAAGAGATAAPREGTATAAATPSGRSRARQRAGQQLKPSAGGGGAAPMMTPTADDDGGGEGGFASPPPPAGHAAAPQPLPMMTPATADVPPPTIAVPARGPPPTATPAQPAFAARAAGTKRTQSKQVKPPGAPGAAVGAAANAAADDPPPGPLRGWGLGGCSEVLACRAARLLHLGRHAECLALTSALLARDPRTEGALPSHLAAALALGKKDELFLRAHRLVAEQPDSAVAWHAAGCYYLSARQPEAARRHFARATQLDRGFAPAWVALAHACSAQGEADQAVAAYRAAHRLFPGLHAPLLGMAAEYARMGSLPLAERLLAQAWRMCPGDPLPAHERGVLALRAGEWATAEAWLRRALALAAERAAPSAGAAASGGSGGGDDDIFGLGGGGDRLPFFSTSAAAAWEPALVNLGHAVRKQGRPAEAARLYEAALALAPGQPGTLAALGLARQLAGDSCGAADAYQRCLALRPDDAFALEMLSEALAEDYERFVEEAEAAEEEEEQQQGGEGRAGGGGGGGGRRPAVFDAFLVSGGRRAAGGSGGHHDDMILV